MRTCPNCSKDISGSGEICTHCHSKLEPDPAVSGGDLQGLPATSKFLIPCPSCNKAVSSESTRCMTCGHPINIKDGETSGFTLLGLISIGVAVIFVLGASQRQMSDRDAGMAALFIAGGMNLVAIGGVITLLRSIRNKV